MDEREARALHIAATVRLEGTNGRWKVPSQTASGHHTVVAIDEDEWICSCPDFEERHDACKHIRAVQITVQREHGGKVLEYSEVVRKTYSQDWRAYNHAQTHERDVFLKLLADLCAGIPVRPRKAHRGRPRLLMSDVVFAIVLQAYVGFSSRRLQSDLRAAAAAGYITAPPSFNAQLRYMKDPEITTLLAELVAWSALPLRAVEQDFAVDSSGFGTSNMQSWYSKKHGREVRKRLWRKAHVMAGVSTHVVSAVEVTPPTINDVNILPGLLDTSARRFDIGDVSADKAYLSHDNVDAIEEHGGTPYIPFKSNTAAVKHPPERSAWARMWHMFEYRSDEFLEHYHQRSNVETVFAMVKTKFGDTLRSRTTVAQDNEVYAKFVAHNLCVLVQSTYELDITVEFGDLAATG